MSHSQTPATRLEGMLLKNKWQVSKKISSGEDGVPGTGGNFSVSYLVENKEDGKVYFLKAFDFMRRLQHTIDAKGNVMADLNTLTSVYQFENMLHQLCDSKRLKRIVRVLDAGDEVLDNNYMHVVPYLILELADHGDIRKYLSTSAEISILAKLQHLKDVALGLIQLHNSSIAHQDIKPSNIMIFSELGAKIGDLGRASLQGQPQIHDAYPIAGDPSYAPPEQIYSYSVNEWFDRRQRCDLYQFGSLITFLFTGSTINTLLKLKLPSDIAPKRWGGTGNSYELSLPHLTQAFEKILTEFDTVNPEWMSKKLKGIVYQCSHPNFKLRGSSKTITMKNPVLGIERFVSDFDLMIKKMKLEGIK
ncbi:MULTISPECIES: protein kinase domain-containing protein [Pantoea]|uniref:protein kinase domain-containing protein n=1 Tax=Pantoea TaxID=53335 RepID=UPI0015FBE0B4|nr:MULTISPECIES: protein kinase [Pantoea]WNK54534.1 protein kinase [Pantoea agglomerans]